MSPTEFDRLVEALIPAVGRTTLTLTEIPASEGELLRILECAVVVGNRRCAPLAEIHLPLDVFPNSDTAFWHVPIEDASREGVVRLVFERRELPTAA
jgi:hypothetical protein